MWRIWAYALGRKEGRNQQDADRIAIIRTLIMVQLIITNFFIIAGNVKTLFFTPTQTDSKVSHTNTKSGVSTYIIDR